MGNACLYPAGPQSVHKANNESDYIILFLYYFEYCNIICQVCAGKQCSVLHLGHTGLVSPQHGIALRTYWYFHLQQDRSSTYRCLSIFLASLYFLSSLLRTRILLIQTTLVGIRALAVPFLLPNKKIQFTNHKLDITQRSSAYITFFQSYYQLELSSFNLHS